MSEKIQDIMDVFGGYTFHHSSEDELQLAVAHVLDEHGLDHEREVILGRRDRIDFLVGDVGIEVKVDGSLSLVTRQVHRYMQSDRISGLILLTSRSKHTNLPSIISDKPVRIVWVSSL